MSTTGIIDFYVGASFCVYMTIFLQQFWLVPASKRNALHFDPSIN